MSFIQMPAERKIVRGTGREGVKIAIVGDYTSRFDALAGKPFSGTVGDVLQRCLHGAGLISGDVYLTNVFKSETKLGGKLANTDFFHEGKKKFTEVGEEHARMLRSELNDLDVNVIIPAGNPALMALTNYNSVAKYRGYVCESTKLNKVRKLIPTNSFSQSVRAYTNRYTIVADLKKAKKESAYPDIRRPDIQVIYEYASIEELIQWLEYIAAGSIVSFDIEVINYEVASISFAITPNISVVVPIGNSDLKPHGWTEWEELLIWRWVQKILGTPDIPKVAQNGMFDIHFLAVNAGVIVRGPLHDTMIGHHIMYPELPKGLGFIGSIYCGSQEYWKDLVKFDNIKGEN